MGMIDDLSLEMTRTEEVAGKYAETLTTYAGETKKLEGMISTGNARRSDMDALLVQIETLKGESNLTRQRIKGYDDLKRLGYSTIKLLEQEKYAAKLLKEDSQMRAQMAVNAERLQGAVEDPTQKMANYEIDSIVGTKAINEELRATTDMALASIEAAIEVVINPFTEGQTITHVDKVIEQAQNANVSLRKKLSEYEAAKAEYENAGNTGPPEEPGPPEEQ